MEPKITSVQKQRGTRQPPFNNRSRISSYFIVGIGFGETCGAVEVIYGLDDTNSLPHIKYWSDTFIEIEQPPRDPLGRDTWVNVLILTRFDGKRSREFELVPPVTQFRQTA